MPITCQQWLSSDVCAFLAWLGSLLNSNFSTALLGSLAGAFAGAVAAQRIVEKTKTREEHLKELRNINAAAMASFTTCNTALALKRQHVKPLYDQFHKDKAALAAFMAARASGQIEGNVPFHFVSDLRTFLAPILPIDTLRNLLFDKLSVGGRPLSLVCAIEDAAHGLERAISMRLSFIERFKSGTIPGDQIPAYYFGMPLPNGETNQEYPDLLFAIHSYLDDVAFFAHLLCGDLTSHAKKLHAAIPESTRATAPKPTEADFTAARASGLIPPDDQYVDWLRAFPQSRADNSAEATK